MVAARTVNIVKRFTDDARSTDEPDPDVGGADIAAVYVEGGNDGGVFWLVFG